MVTVYILLSFQIFLSLFSMVLLIVSANFLVRAVRKLDDITVGISTLIDRSNLRQRPTTRSGEPSGLVDIPYVGSYDLRYEPPQDQ